MLIYYFQKLQNKLVHLHIKVEKKDMLIMREYVELILKILMKFMKVIF